MNREKALSRLSCLALVAFLLSACAGAQPSTSPPPSVRPVAGAFQGSTDPRPGSTDPSVSLILIVFADDSDVIDYVYIACRPQGVISGLPAKVAKDVEIAAGQFSVEHNDVVIQGRFTSSTAAEGTIRALTADARGCGVPDAGTWTVECNLAATKEGEGFSLHEATSGPCAKP